MSHVYDRDRVTRSPTWLIVRKDITRGTKTIKTKTWILLFWWFTFDPCTSGLTSEVKSRKERHTPTLHPIHYGLWRSSGRNFCFREYDLNEEKEGRPTFTLFCHWVGVGLYFGCDILTTFLFNLQCTPRDTSSRWGEWTDVRRPDNPFSLYFKIKCIQVTSLGTMWMGHGMDYEHRNVPPAIKCGYVLVRGTRSWVRSCRLT